MCGKNGGIIMKITIRTLNEVMYDSFFHSFEGVICDRDKQLKKAIENCEQKNEPYTMSRAVQKIYKEMQKN